MLDHDGQRSVSILTARRGSRRETVIGVRGNNLRVSLRVSTLQIAADRGTGRNPGATRFPPQTFTARVTRLLVPGGISSAPRATERLSCVVPAAPHAARTVLVSPIRGVRSTSCPAVHFPFTPRGA